MAAHALFDPATPPTHEVIRAVLGPAGPHWDDLVGRISAMGARATFRWDGPRYGWSLRGIRAGRPFVTLTPREGDFTALVILGRTQADEVAQMALGPHVRDVFEAARQHPDGRWLFIPVEAPLDVDDVAAVLETKLPPTVRAKVAAAR